MKLNLFLKYLFVFLFFGIICFSFFNESFKKGNIIQGNDYTYWIAESQKNQLKRSSVFFDNNYYLGLKSSNVLFNLHYLILYITNPDNEQSLTYFFSILFGMIFMFLFLQRLGLDLISSTFGAIAFGFTPHFLTLITASHVLVINTIPYYPLLCLLGNIILDNKINNLLLKIPAILTASAIWAFLLSDDPQRGIYFSAFYILYLLFEIFKNNNITFKDLNLKKFIKKDIIKSIIFCIITGILAIVLTMNYVINNRETLKSRQSLQGEVKTEEEKWAFATSWSQNPLELLESIMPGFFGRMSGDPEYPYWGKIEYAGSSHSLTFFVVIFALLSLFLFKENSYIKLFFIAGVLYILLSFGKYFPLLYKIVYKLPLMSNFRAPIKFMSVAAFCFSVLASFGLSYFINLNKNKIEKKQWNRILIYLFSILAFGIIVYFVFLISKDSILSYLLSNKFTNANKAIINTTSSILNMLVYSIIFITLFLIGIYYENRYKYLKIIISVIFVILLTYDIFKICKFYYKKSVVSKVEAYTADPLVSYLRKLNISNYRVGTSLFVPGVLYPNAPESIKKTFHPIPLSGIKNYYLTYLFPYYKINTFDITATSFSIPEYDNYFNSIILKSLETKKQLNTIEDLYDINKRLLSISGVRYIISDQILGNSSLKFLDKKRGIDGRDKYIFENPDALPIAGLFENFYVSGSDEEILKLISDPFIDYQNTLIIKGNFKDVLLNNEKVKEQKILDYGAGYFKIELNGKSDTFLYLNVKYDKGWKAYIDNKETPIYQANYIGMAILAEEGKHIVEFIYKPDNKIFEITKILLIVFAIISIVSLVLSFRFKIIV